MLLTKLKAKNQLTLPKAVVTQLNLHPNEFFQVDVMTGWIKLIPVSIEPRYTQEELDAVDRIVDREKHRAKAIGAKKDFIKYLKKFTK